VKCRGIVKYKEIMKCRGIIKYRGIIKSKYNIGKNTIYIEKFVKAFITLIS
jgi:hypothetical protein